jgi:hypothetical protein
MRQPAKLIQITPGTKPKKNSKTVKKIPKTILHPIDMEGWNAGSIVKDCKGPESFSTCRGPQASDSHWSTPKHPSWSYEMRSVFFPELSHWCGNLIVGSVTQTFSLRFTCGLELEFNR